MSAQEPVSDGVSNDLPGLRRDLAERFRAIKARHQAGELLPSEDIDFILHIGESAVQRASEWMDEWGAEVSRVRGTAVGDLASDPDVRRALDGHRDSETREPGPS